VRELRTVYDEDITHLVNPQPAIHHHYITEEDHRTHPVAVRLLERLLAG
jgi:hypothetical protein